MIYSYEKLKVNKYTSDVLKSFNAMPKPCFDIEIQEYFPEDYYLMTKSSGMDAIIIAVVKGNFITFNRFEF